MTANTTSANLTTARNEIAPRTPRQALIEVLNILGGENYATSKDNGQKLASKARRIGLDLECCYEYLIDRHNYTNGQIGEMCEATVLWLAEEHMDAEAHEMAHPGRVVVGGSICKSGWQILESLANESATFTNLTERFPQYSTNTIRAQVQRLRTGGYITSSRVDGKTVYQPLSKANQT